ncbi:MAG: rhomboid protease GluP, partial [Myxococcota bacterium]
MRAWLRDDGHEYPVDLADLDALIRQGALSADSELRHVPWTGDRFCKLRQISQLQDALDAPDARFADYLRHRQAAWLTGAVAAMVMGAAMVQSALSGSELPWAAARVQRTFHQWAVGLEPTLLDGRWWTLWSSQLAHADLLHALFNVPIIAYCGYRVEQALAPGGALAVMAAALLCGGVAIVGLDNVPVYGSSIVAYGLWSAQIAIGLRMNEAVPPPLRGRYGMGNLIFFAPLYAASLFNAEVSHLGHGGGIIGGALVAFFLSAESMAPAAEQERARARVLLLTGLLTIAPLLLFAAASRLPTLAYAPYTQVYIEDAGARLRLPARMAQHPVPVGELDGWRPSENGNEPFFVDQVYL